MGQELAQSEVREVASARSGGGVESARSGPERGGALPTQARFLPSLQQTAGNRAVSGLVQRLRDGSEDAGPLQGRFARVQRKGPEEEEPLQGRLAPVQRQRPEDEKLQMKQAPSPPAQLQAEPVERRNDTGLPDGLKSGIESLSGISLDDVRVHYGSARPARLDALAFAHGSEIHVAPGQEQHLPHEAWHVVQQAQGRVQPTTLLAGQQFNDDPLLEREADEWGSKAAAGPAANSAADRATDSAAGLVAGSAATGQRQASARPVTATVQAIMSVAEFQAATPGGLLKPRATVTQIDQALATYVGARTIVHAGNLVGVIQHYVGGQHDPARIVVAHGLLQRAQAEHDLLQRIGDANAFLVDGLIEQVGMARLAQLLQLAASLTAPQASVLPHLIETIGVGNINNLNMSGIVAAITPARAGLLAPLIATVGGVVSLANLTNLTNLVAVAGAPHMPLLASMITQSGGAGQLPALRQVVNRHPNNADLAFDLTREAGGDPLEFARLATEVPMFMRAAGPGVVPPGVLAAVQAYNLLCQAALRGNVIAALTTLHGQGVIARAQAAALPAGLLNAVQARLVAVQNRIAALNPPAAAPLGPADLNVAVQLRNILEYQVGQQLAAAGPVPPAFTAALNQVIAEQANVNNAGNVLPVASVNFDHFLARHTAHYFDFGDIKPDNTQWNPAWGGAAAGHVEAGFIQVLNGLAAAGSWLMPGVPQPNQPLAGGGSARIGGLANAAGTAVIVGQFFPEHTPGVNIYDHRDTTMRAIFKVL